MPYYSKKGGPITRDTAKALAIRYHSYREALRTNDPNEIHKWGALLAEAQKRTGVELIEKGLIERRVSWTPEGASQ